MTGNFDFLQAEWPALYAEAKAAERDALFDPRTTVFYSRRTIELAVKWIYDVKQLPPPYKNDLSARLHEPKFVSLVGPNLLAKMNLVRKVGNNAVHDPRPLQPDIGIRVLTELFHVLSWLARTFATQPSSKPDAQRQFDKNLVPQPGAAKAKTAAQLKTLADELAAKDALLAQGEAEVAELKKQLAARDAQIAEHANSDELIAQLQAKVAAAQATAEPDTHDYKEAETRSDIIDILLREAGWTLADKRDREYPVTGMPDGKKGYVDYVLWSAEGKPLAVVEAKRTSKDAKVGQQQAKLYADCLEAMTGQRPVIYYTNGFEHFFWDDLDAPPRPIDGFHTRDELELRIQRRTSRKTLKDFEIPKHIVERPYQDRAIRRVTEHFEDDRQRAALLVMATGSGKTRTVIALTDMLMRANWAKRVLFLADRKALVKQAGNAFKTFLPESSAVNLLTERNTDGRVYICTYPTMMGLINETDNGLRRFGPGYFDLIIIDEAHRSVYQKYRHIFSYFDSLLLGLTATPKDEVDFNTYQLFQLETGIPTDNYSLEEAIEDGYLVPPRAVNVPLKFQRTGIKYDDLTEDEKTRWDELDWESDDENAPDGVDAEAINKWLFNTDTVDKALEVLMEKGHKVAGGDKLGKTIIFAKNQRHADFIADRFNASYPQYNGHFARVITHAVEHSQQLIDDFSMTDKLPQIAISVDMLDTGIDVPDIVNLVFFKPVRSKSKFWQMVGRGTRLRRNLYGPEDIETNHKSDFFIFDLCGNFDFFNAHPDASEGSMSASLSERLFTARVELIGSLDRHQTDKPIRDSVTDILFEQVHGMRLDNFLVRRQRRTVEKYRERTEWDSIPEQKMTELIETLAPLPTTVTDRDEFAKRFDLLCIRSQLAVVKADDTLDKYRNQIRSIAEGLLEQLSIPKIKEKEELLRDVAGDEWWVDVTLPMLESSRKQLRGIVGLLEKAKRPLIYTNFEDTLGEIDEIEMPQFVSGTNVERFNAKVRDYLNRQPDNLALKKLKTGKALTSSDLESLQELLTASGVGSPEDFERAVQNADGLARFIRSLVGLDRQAAQEAFAEFLAGKTATSNQIAFIELIIKHLTKHGTMEPELLYQSPFTDHAPQGFDSMFEEEQVMKIVDVIHGFNDSAAIA
ncbi:DEAD/DEAH box helicase family protein [Rhodococcoides kyotonense]|uniref:Type I restriction enzyme, R subunit n=1 Tax=Rhodococcoides kyotonense TaxID=398843 RepID=A0A239L852_9NOCA|nr:DEAD/DEAH box helicase family protein [Rhodococcus kyotonensis]SNT25704.1 type I restriction enzyme, R subunit [Rhodococcus kyotonensis]